MQIIIEGVIDRQTAEQAAASLRDPARGRCGETLETRAALAPLELLNLAAAIASVAQAAAAAWSLWAAERNRAAWSAERLRELIDQEMAIRDVFSYKLVSVEGFENLPSRSQTPCVAEIQDTSRDTTYTLFIFSDGDTLVVRVE